jgi:hypothetical protein
MQYLAPGKANYSPQAMQSSPQMSQQASNLTSRAIQSWLSSRQQQPTQPVYSGLQGTWGYSTPQQPSPSYGTTGYSPYSMGPQANYQPTWSETMGSMGGMGGSRPEENQAWYNLFGY